MCYIYATNKIKREKDRTNILFPFKRHTDENVASFFGINNLSDKTTRL